MRYLPLALTLALSTLVACGGTPQPPPGPPEPPASASATPSAAPSATPSAAPSASPSTTPTAAAACVGKVETPEGLKEVDDPELLKQALGEPGKGGLCMGKVFEALRPV